jgi:hypothetical protein
MHLRTETETEQLEHPFCNKLFTTFIDDHNLYMLVTLCPEGDLLKMQVAGNIRGTLHIC